MKVKILSAMGPFGTNCYIVYNDNNEAVLVDAPCDAEFIYSKLNDMNLKLSAVLLTHGHLDHIGAVSDLVSLTDCKVYIHSADYSKLYDNSMNLSDYFGLSDTVKPFKSAVTVDDNSGITVGDMTFSVIATPGHSSGSVCYRIDDILFSGDTLFQSSIGRTDMPDGNGLLLMKSLKKLTDIKENLSVYPGHGSITDLDTEKKTNYYLGANFYDLDI